MVFKMDISMSLFLCGHLTFRNIDILGNGLYLFMSDDKQLT